MNYFGKLSDFTSLERWKLMDLVNQVKTAIATLPKKPANTPIGHYVAAGSRNHITWTLQPLTLECSKAIPLPCCPDHSEILFDAFRKYGNRPKSRHPWHLVAPDKNHSGSG